MPTDQSPKQQVAQRIKDASNILVTVSRNPSVDELSAAMALSLMLDKLDKASTAVFSGEIPAAIDFLEPGKAFDTNVDGLRDFIIALDKSKADRLRYKVEGDVVRVFITPYRTTISESDLSFSQGDFNVDLVVAFGVNKNDDLDTAISAHGRILHDASVITVNAGSEGSLGEINWNDDEASSVCEMLMSLSESLKSGILDESIASALLTGLVAATDRFRNEKTSPKVMTMSAQLMAAGANQQLIAENLEDAGELDVKEVKTEKKKSANPGEIIIERTEEAEPNVSVDEKVESTAETVADEQSAAALQAAESGLAEVAASDDSSLSPAKVSSWRDARVPSTGGTLNATTEQAAEDARVAKERDRNRVLLSHDKPDDIVSNVAPSVAPISAPPALNAATLESPEPKVADIFAAPPSVLTTAPSGMQFESTVPSIPTATPEPIVANPTLADLEQQVAQNYARTTAPAVDNVDAARAAVDSAFFATQDQGSYAPVVEQAPVSEPVATPAPEFGLPAQSIADPVEANPVFAPAPPPPALPPLPDFSTLPPLPSEAMPQQPMPTQEVPAAPTFGLPVVENPTGNPFLAPPPTKTDPSQFQLPTQQ